MIVKENEDDNNDPEPVVIIVAAAAVIAATQQITEKMTHRDYLLLLYPMRYRQKG